eukprot:g10865.t1
MEPSQPREGASPEAVSSDAPAAEVRAEGNAPPQEDAAEEEQEVNDEESDDEEAQAPIRRLEPDDFEHPQVVFAVLSDTFHHYYLSLTWTGSWYRKLAYMGFIAVQHDEKYLLPEIQRSYCVLDFQNLHIGRKARRLLKKTAYRLYNNRNWDLCVRRINEYWGGAAETAEKKKGGKNWFVKKYADVVQEAFAVGLSEEGKQDAGGVADKVALQDCNHEGTEARSASSSSTKRTKTAESNALSPAAGSSAPAGEPPAASRSPAAKPRPLPPAAAGIRSFQPHSIELYDASDNLIAGECGYSFGSVYTSLTGFCDKNFAGAGTLQMYYLGRWLQKSGYKFWNMGHPPGKKRKPRTEQTMTLPITSPEATAPRTEQTMKYKADLGGEILERGCFLKRWNEARDAAPGMGGGLGEEFLEFGC